MKELLSAGISLLTIVTLGLGLYLAIVRFVLKRESASFLRITIEHRIVANNDANSLVCILV